MCVCVCVCVNEKQPSELASHVSVVMLGVRCSGCDTDAAVFCTSSGVCEGCLCVCVCVCVGGGGYV